MATGKAQRIGIWVIAITLTAGTLLGFVAMIIAPNNEAAQQQTQQEQFDQQLKDFQEQSKAAAEARAASSLPLDGYKSEKFDGDAVKEVKVETIKEGDGETLKGTETVSALYFGWTPDGKIFDSSNQDGTVEPADLMLENGVIAAFREGLTGVKVGSTVKITTPADKAYGDEDRGDGSPIGPLQFIVEVKEIK